MAYPYWAYPYWAYPYWPYTYWAYPYWACPYWAYPYWADPYWAYPYWAYIYCGTQLFEARPKLPQTSRPRNIFGHFGSTFDQQFTKFDQAGMSTFLEVLFFWK